MQLAITLAFPLGPGAYDTLILDGIQKITASFLLFWNLLAPAGDAETYLRRVVTAPDFLRAPPQYSGRLLDIVRLPDESMDRNPVDVALAPVITRYFSDLTDEGKDDVLQRAYVETGRQAHYGKQVDALLADQVPRLGPKIEAVETTKKHAPAVDTALRNIAVEETNKGAGKVLVFVGGVGAGKTTFQHRYFRFLIDGKLRGRIVPIFLDFTKTSEQTDLGEFSDAAVLEYLAGDDLGLELSSWETLLQVYRREVEGLRRGVLAPYWSGNKQRFEELISDELQRLIAKTETHIARVLDHLRANRRIEV